MSVIDFESARTGGVASAADAEAMSEAARLVARRLRRARLSPAEPVLVMAALDLGAMTIAFALAAALGGAGLDGQGLASAFGLGLIAVGAIRFAKGYRLARLRRRSAGILTFAAAAAFAWGVGQPLGWTQVPPAGLAPLILALGLPARGVARLLSGWVIDFGLTERRAIVIGGGAEAERLIRGLAANPDNDIRIWGMFDDRGGHRSAPMIADVPRLGTTRELLTFAREAEIDMLIVALPLAATDRIQQILRPLSVLPLDIRLSTYSADMEFRRGGLSVLGARPLDGRGAVLKRAADLIGASLALALFAVPMMLVALAIRLDSPGPALFRQPRHGFNHRPILVWKFRSMYSDDCDPAARRIVTRDDPRVTRVGRFIRKYSIDELPQLFNVLRGDLSLVGPRPHAVVAITSQQVAFAEIVDGYAARHRMRPGITGWAQVEGWRGEVDQPEKLRRRFEHDLYYIENWSLWFDLRILALTPFRLLNTASAY